jgi:hypothetical protein
MINVDEFHGCRMAKANSTGVPTYFQHVFLSILSGKNLDMQRETGYNQQKNMGFFVLQSFASAPRIIE